MSLVISAQKKEAGAILDTVKKGFLEEVHFSRDLSEVSRQARWIPGKRLSGHKGSMCKVPEAEKAEGVSGEQGD